MKSIPFFLAVLVGMTASLAAEYSAPQPVQATPGTLNEYLRAQDASLGAWDFGVNLRFRYEDKEEAGTTKAGSNWDFSARPQDDNDNRYELLRVMPHLGYTSSEVAFYVEGRTSYSYSDQRYNASAAGNGLTERDGPIDLYQAYVLLGNPKKFPLTAKIGRQEIALADQRLVGPAKWGNTPRTFDAAKLRWQSPQVAVDAFTSSPVYIDNNNANHSNSQDLFSGVYVSLPKLSPKETVETYLLSRNTARGIVTDNWAGVPSPNRFPAPQDIYTLGFRTKSNPKAYGPWDYTIDAMYQFGDRAAVFPSTTVAAALAAPRLEQRAYAYIIQGGYSWAKTWGNSRAGFVFSHASGDKNSTDGKSETFQNLFPSNHLVYGLMDLGGLENINDFKVTYTLKPTKAWVLSLEGHEQWLDRTTDYWYKNDVPRNFTGSAVGSGAGYRINPTYGRKLGEEIDLLGGYSVNKYATVETGVAHYFRGAYIKESLRKVGSLDANYMYVQLTLNL